MKTSLLPSMEAGCPLPAWRTRASALHRRDAMGRRSARAFTLVELLVAAGITALLAGMMAVIVMNVSSTWSRASTRLGADAQARIVLDQIQLDLQGALFRDDGNVWFAVDLLNASNGGQTGLWQIAARNPKPAGGLSLDVTATRAELRADERGRLERSRFGTAGVWLRFFTSSRANNSSTNTMSAPVAVGYQIIRRYTATNPANLNTAYVLNRSEARPATANGRIGVLEAGYNITSANYTTSTVSTNSGAITGDPRSIQVPGAVRNLDSIFADNVIDFGVRCYVRDANVPGGLRLIFPATTGGALTNSPSALRGQLPSNTPPESPVYQTRFLFPDVVDVMIRILTDKGAELIADIERVQTPTLTVPQKYNSNAQQWWWGIAEENSRVYTRRIALTPQPL
jgi:type II secretory pathway pseudopilin PulG